MKIKLSTRLQTRFSNDFSSPDIDKNILMSASNVYRLIVQTIDRVTCQTILMKSP